MHDTLATLKRERFVALARHIPHDDIADVAKALLAGGVRIMEITFDPCDSQTLSNTARAIEAANEAGMLTGAGTVLDMNAAEAAHAAGAKFIVSPNTDANIVAKTKALGMLSIPGAYTPTEIAHAFEIGADIVKIFPVLPHQLDYLRVVRGPLPHIPVMVTGGISTDNAGDFIKAGATAVAAGASIIKPELVKTKNWNAITELAEKIMQSINKGTNNE